VPTARAFVARAETLILVLLIVIGLGASAVGLDTVEYDFAEIKRAHSVRLAAEWLRPHRDFFDCRPPNFAFLTRSLFCPGGTLLPPLVMARWF
jgi:hypothetical protein